MCVRVCMWVLHPHQPTRNCCKHYSFTSQVGGLAAHGDALGYGTAVNAPLAVDVEIPNGVDSTRDKEGHGKSSSEGDGVLVSVDGETVTMRTSSSGEQISSANTQSVQIGPMFALTTTASCHLHLFVGRGRHQHSAWRTRTVVCTVSDAE
jgi:hypothetical protein